MGAGVFEVEQRVGGVRVGPEGRGGGARRDGRRGRATQSFVVADEHPAGRVVRVGQADVPRRGLGGGVACAAAVGRGARG